MSVDSKPDFAIVRQFVCELCGRNTKRPTTAHHLIPRTCHKNRWFKKNFSREQMQECIELCVDCHREIHRLIPSEKELGRNLNTIEKLKSHPAIENFLVWIRRQK